MSLGRDLMSKSNGTGRGDMSAQVGIDWARRTVRRAEQGLPVNRDELRQARRIVEHVRQQGGVA